MKKTVWGIIGCGDVAEVKSGPAFQICDHSSLLAVMRRDRARAKDFAHRHQVPLYFDNVEAILKHPDINAVYIATPPSTHLHFALAALKSGKHVYLEKPMTLNAEEAKTLYAAVKQSDSKLSVAHYRRQLPAFLKVKALLDANEIGDVICADIQILQPRTPSLVAASETNWRLNPSVSGGGYFHDLAPHQLDLMLHWFGEVKHASGFSSDHHPNSNVASTVNGVMQFENGVQFKGLWSFNVPQADKKDECIIYGTKGRLKFSFFGDDVQLNLEGKQTVFKFANPKHIQQPMIQQSINYFLGKASNPCSAEEGLAVMKIMDSFTQATV